MLSSKEIVCPNNLLDLAHKKKGVKVAVVNAGKPLPMLSIQDAVNENLIEPIFIGHEVEIQKCAEDIKWDISKPDGTPKKLLDVSRLIQLGWQARIPLEDGLASTVTDFRNQISQDRARL